MKAKTMILTLMLTTATYACPILKARCLNSAGILLGEVTYGSTYHGAAPECAAMPSEVEILAACSTRYPATTIIKYALGADSWFLHVGDELVESHGTPVVWDTDFYAHTAHISTGGTR